MTSTVHSLGFDSGMAGEPADSCPFLDDSRRKQWLASWRDGRDALADRAKSAIRNECLERGEDPPPVCKKKTRRTA